MEPQRTGLKKARYRLARLLECKRERNEQIALRIVGICFLPLSAYIAYESIADLCFKPAPEHSGIILACVSLVVMPL